DGSVDASSVSRPVLPAIDRSAAIAVSANALQHGGFDIGDPWAGEIHFSKTPRACSAAGEQPFLNDPVPRPIRPGDSGVRVSIGGDDKNSAAAVGRYAPFLPLDIYQVSCVDGASPGDWHVTDAVRAIVEVDAIDESHVAGAVDVTLENGDRIVYAFDAPIC